MRIERDEAVAVLVDYQERLLPAMDEKETLLATSKRLLQGLKILNVPMIATQQYTKGLGETDSTIMEAAGLTSYEEKLSFSAMEVIREKLAGRKYVLLCGIEAHICVLQTAIDLKAEGYVPVLVTDCVSSRTRANKEMAFERAKQEGILLTTYEAILFELLHTAGTEESKRIQKLVK